MQTLKMMINIDQTISVIISKIENQQGAGGAWLQCNIYVCNQDSVLMLNTIDERHLAYQNVH